GVIGCGWFGMELTKSALNIGGVSIVSLCDVDSAHLKNSADQVESLQGSRPKEYKEYSELIDNDKLHAVIIASPPQWHALQFVAACQKGLDIYCEKPLAYDIYEGLAMIKAAEKAGNIVQIGFQQRNNVIREKARSIIQEGRLGKIHQIEAHIHYTPDVGDTSIQAPPESLDWEAWCGPAPKLPYRPSIGHFQWRLEKEYGNGHLVDWGIHHIDFIRKIMDFEAPVSVTTNGDNVAHRGMITTPDTLHARMEFDQCPVIWQHRMWGTGTLNPSFKNGYTFYGEEGTMYGDYNKLIIQPRGRGSEQALIEMLTNAVLEKNVSSFLEAVKTRNRDLLMCRIEDAFQSTAAVQLAMISFYTESKVEWDQENKVIRDNGQASKLLSRPYRGDYLRPDA
ncbi:MAG: Gfo/Idh/MocA family oxidoreductase, partial [Eudoraea sp.]|nr:Gfo/Idh/MocA family oxidoreductase [Eudoraea sp.]